MPAKVDLQQDRHPAIQLIDKYTNAFGTFSSTE
jgi:hypothetical protein